MKKTNKNFFTMDEQDFKQNGGSNEGHQNELLEPCILACGYRHISIPAQEIIDRAVNLNCELVGGILEKECNEIFGAAIKLEKAQL